MIHMQGTSEVMRERRDGEGESHLQARNRRMGLKASCIVKRKNGKEILKGKARGEWK